MRASSGDDGVRSLRGTIGWQGKAVKRTRRAAKAGLLGRRTFPNGEALGLGAAGRPIVRRKRNTPEARGWLIEFDADAALVVDTFADVHNLAADFFARFNVAKTQVVANDDHLFHQDKSSMGIYHLGDGFFRERGARGEITSDNDVHGEQDALAAANSAGFCGRGFELGRFQGKTPSKEVSAEWRRDFRRRAFVPN